MDGKADFECSEYFDENTDLLVKCDTLIASSTLSWFGSNREYLSYQWKVGSDTNIRYGKSFLIQFTKPFGTIPVTLIGTRKPRPECLPGDDGVDTFTKGITIVDWKASPLKGKYQGFYQSNPADIFTIEIKFDHTITQLAPSPILLNLFRNCDVILGLNVLGYKQFASEGISNQFSPSLQCYFNQYINGTLDKSNQQITISYWRNGIQENFIGWRIQ